MQELKLRHEIMSKVFDGTKCSTSRLGVRDTTLGPLKLVETENSDVSIIVDVVLVQAIPFNKISDKEAFNEGYSSAEELKQTLRNIYGKDFSDDEFFTIVEWTSKTETGEGKYNFWQHENVIGNYDYYCPRCNNHFELKQSGYLPNYCQKCGLIMSKKEG